MVLVFRTSTQGGLGVAEPFCTSFQTRIAALLQKRLVLNEIIDNHICVDVVPIGTRFLHSVVGCGTRWWEIPIAWIFLVEWLAITSKVIWHAIVMYLLWPDALQNMLVQTILLCGISPSRGTDRLFTKSEDKVPFVVRSNLDLELNLLPWSERCHWSLIPAQKSTRPASGPGMPTTHTLWAITVCRIS
jgi:hypothetical protein